MRHSIKAEPFFLRILDEKPVRELRDFLGSGFPDSLRVWKRLRFRAHPTVEFRELSKQERLPDSTHGVKVKVEVVVGGQNGPQHLTGHKEVAKIPARIPLAHRAGAVRDQAAARPARSARS